MPQLLYADDTVHEDVSIVVNHNVVEDLSLLTLRSIFSKRKRSWENGQTITVVVLPDDHTLHKQFCRRVLKMYPYVLRDHWDRITFSGTGTAPILAKSEEDLKHIVAHTPGAIGYIRSMNPHSNSIHILNLSAQAAHPEKRTEP